MTVPIGRDTPARMLAFIRQHSGSHFDPQVVDKFIALISSIEDDG
jgi:response regulator RpfG family c-di-GMP phosphodiesterase